MTELVVRHSTFFRHCSLVGHSTFPAHRWAIRHSLRDFSPAALLVLLSTTTRARVISTDLWSFPDDGLDLRWFGTATVGALVSVTTRRDGHFAGGLPDVFANAVAAGVFVDGGGLAVVAAGLGLADDAGAEDQVGDLVADARHHLLE